MKSIYLSFFFCVFYQLAFGKPTAKLSTAIHGKENNKYEAHTHDDLMREHEMEEKTEERVANVVEGDMKLSDALKSLRNGKEADSRDVLTLPQYQWNKEIPYIFSDTAGDYLKNVVQSAIDDFNNYTCVRFVPRASQSDYIQFTTGSGCWSYVGKIGGMQEINLGAGCELKGTAIHEMMHSLGFFHEHTRLDRDEYVKINFDNLVSGVDDNFKKYQIGIADYYGQGYDFSSIMHYRTTAFSSNGQPTIIPLDQSIDASSIGQRSGFSDIDLTQIRKAMKCDEIVSTTKPTTNTPTGAVPTTVQTTQTTKVLPTTDIIVDIKTTTVKPTTTVKSTTVKPTTVKPTTKSSTTTAAVISTNKPATVKATTVAPTVSKSTTTKTTTTKKNTVKPTAVKDTTKAPPSNPAPTTVKIVSSSTQRSTKSPPSNPSPTKSKVLITTTRTTKTTTTTKKVKSTPVPPAPSKPPTPPQATADRTKEVGSIFPKVTKIPQIYNGPPLSTPCSDYPCWPHDFSWSMSSTTNNCNCRHIIGNCHCKCVNMDNDIVNEGKGNHLCYKRSKHDPLFIWTTKDKLPGKKCIASPKENKSQQKKKYLCYSSIPGYELKWLDSNDSGRLKMRCVEAYSTNSGTNKLLCGKQAL